MYELDQQTIQLLTWFFGTAKIPSCGAEECDKMYTLGRGINQAIVRFQQKQQAEQAAQQKAQQDKQKQKESGSAK